MHASPSKMWSVNAAEQRRIDHLSAQVSSNRTVMCPGFPRRRTPRYRLERLAVVRVCSWVWMVVWFVCVIRVPVCARVSRVCPGSPRCVFLPVGKSFPKCEDSILRLWGSSMSFAFTQCYPTRSHDSMPVAPQPQETPSQSAALSEGAPKMIVLGAGGSGLAAAVLLARDHGMQVEVYDSLSSVQQDDLDWHQPSRHGDAEAR